MQRPVKTPRTHLCFSAAHETLKGYRQLSGELHPPIAIDTIASWLGFQVIHLYNVPDEFSALVSTRDKLIGINGRHHRHRQRFSLSHEVAHIVMKHSPENQCSREAIALYNSEADLCASELLMPDFLLQPAFAKTQDIAQLVRVFDVSREAMERRVARMKSGS